MMMKIGEVFCLIRNGASIKQSDGASGIPITRIETISNRIVDRNKFGYANISNASEYQDYLLQDGDILMSHINSEKHLGKTALYRKYSGEQIIHGMNLLLLRPNAEILLADYAMYILNSEMFLRQLPRITKKSVNQASFNISALKELDVYIPSINRQKEIVSVLDKVDAMLERYKTQFKRLDDLVKSRFVEMFGDTLLNTKEWTENCLESLADIVSGITKGRKAKEENLTEVPYMAVSNVKDGHIDWTTVKTIMATRQEINQYKLQSDDVLMTEGGDPDKVGRGAIIKNPPINCIHQNHIFRVRLDEGSILPTYFAEYLQHQKAKRYFLGCAKQTTGIASINMRQLKSLPVLLPPLELQNRFAAFVAEVDKSKLAVTQSLEKLETLKKSLMQEYFG